MLQSWLGSQGLTHPAEVLSRYRRHLLPRVSCNGVLLGLQGSMLAVSLLPALLCQNQLSSSLGVSPGFKADPGESGGLGALCSSKDALRTLCWDLSSAQPPSGQGVPRQLWLGGAAPSLQTGDSMGLPPGTSSLLGCSCPPGHRELSPSQEQQPPLSRGLPGWALVDPPTGDPQRQQSCGAPYTSSVLQPVPALLPPPPAVFAVAHMLCRGFVVPAACRAAVRHNARSRCQSLARFPASGHKFILKHKQRRRQQSHCLRGC